MVQLLHILMLSPFPFSTLIVSTLVIRSILAIRRSNWLFLWLALEINIISFIPLIIITRSNQETESAIKYFLIQALGSRILLIYSICIIYSALTSTIISTLLIIRLLIKLGAAPFHPWFPQVILGSTWSTCFLLSTWQKLAPLLLLVFMYTYAPVLLFFSSLTALIGGMLGINQSKLRSLIAYSSLVHLGWMIGLSYRGYPILTLAYFIIYTLIAAPIFITFHFIRSSSIAFSATSSNYMPLFPFIIGLLLLSLSGIPPLTGFIPKWIAISTMWNAPSILLTLIISSLISTFYYLNLTFSAIMASQTSQDLPQNSSAPLPPIIITASSTMLLAPLLIY